jgi:hypothetical protein
MKIKEYRDARLTVVLCSSLKVRNILFKGSSAKDDKDEANPNLKSVAHILGRSLGRNHLWLS